MRKTAVPAPALLMLAVLFPFPCAQGEDGCYSLVAGKNATAYGGVLLAHNEDNSNARFCGMLHVPRQRHEAEETVAFGQGGSLPQAETTFAFWWLRMPDRLYSDAMLNEHGVAVVSNSCPSREDRPELEHGGIAGPVLRRLLVERSKTAREGVELAGSLVQQFGYADTGRTLVICDPGEGWMVHLVYGKHWVAQRVADDQVALIANSYSIRNVDLSDPSLFLGSPDLLDYARSRGWWDPAKGPFDFEKAYASRSRLQPGNLYRQWGGFRVIDGGVIPPPEKAEYI